MSSRVKRGLHGGSSTDDDGGSSNAMLNTTSENASRTESKKAMKGLLQHFHNFADNMHQASEHDTTNLIHQVTQVEEMARENLDLEIEEREKAVTAVEKRCDALERALHALQKNHPGLEPLSQRVDELETTFSAWADKHTRDVELLRRSNDKVSKELATYSEAHEEHLEVEASLDTAVKGLTSAAEQTAKALAAAKAKLDHMQAGLADCEHRCSSSESREASFTERLKDVEKRLETDISSCSREVVVLKSDHQKVKTKLAEVHSLVEKNSAAHKENLDHAVKCLAASADQNTKALASAKAKLDIMHETVQGCEHHCAAVEDKHAVMVNRLRESEQRLMGNIGSCSKDMEALKNDHRKLSGDVKKQLADAHVLVEHHVASHKQSLDAAVKNLSTNTDQVTRDLPALKAKIDRMHEGTLSAEQRCAAAESKHAALEARLKDAEQKLEGHGGNHARELENLRNEHGNLSRQVKQHMSETKDLMEHHASTHKGHLERHTENHSSLSEKHEVHARDLRTLKDDHAKHDHEMGLLKRHIDGAMGELATNTASELKTTREEMDQVLLLLAGVQRAWKPAGAAREARKTPSRRSRSCADDMSPKMPKAGFDVSVDLLRSNADGF